MSSSSTGTPARRRRTRDFSTYTKPESHEIKALPMTHKPSVLLPLYPPPSSTPPSLATQSRRQPLKDFTLTRHTFPAAYPRTLAQSVRPASSPVSYFDDPFGTVTGESKESRKANIRKAAITAQRMNIKAEFNDARGRTVEEAEEVVAERGEKGLWLAANRFLRQRTGPQPRSRSNAAKSASPTEEIGAGITLVVVHANGFCKEMWEPTLAMLLYTDTPGMTGIDEIWTIDLVHHAESYGLNDGSVGEVQSWTDNARDVLSLLQCCLPSTTPDQSDIPQNLTYASPGGPNKSPKRRYVGMGHSIGGNALVQAAHADPTLFERLILVDPMTRPLVGSAADKERGIALSMSCVGRRNVWESRDQARDLLLRSAYFQAWHPAVFDAFLNHGLVTLPDGKGVTLSTPRWAEAACFSHGPGMRDGWDKLAGLSPDVRVDFLMAGDASSTGGPETTRELVWRPPNAGNLIVEPASHFIPYDQPKLLAEAIREVLAIESKFVAEGSVQARL